MAGRGSLSHRATGMAGALAALLTGIALIAVACTSSASPSPSAGSGGGTAGMPGMPGMAGTAGMGDMPGMGDVTAAPTTPALAAAAPKGYGLTSSLHGYTLVPSEKTLAAGKAAAYTFRITGPNGHAVTRYQPYESAFVICYVVRSDLSEYRYLQPAMREDGSWSVSMPALPAGSYRAYATFAAPDSSQGTPLLYQLSVPLAVTGESGGPASGNVSGTTADDYTVSITGKPKAGTSGPLAVVVAKHGKPVESFQRFLDSYVHLTAFHAGDLAFAQVLTLGGIQPRTGAVTAEAMFPESGVWRVYAQFDVDGTVHTSALTLDVG